MKRSSWLISLLVLVGWVAGLGASYAYYQTTAAYRTFAPLVANGPPPASICDPSKPLSERDIGALSVDRQADGSYDVAYQDRKDGGGRAHVAKHIGDHLEELSAPTREPTAPAFSPDGAKQGALALVAAAGADRSRLYYTQRMPGDITGPYMLWCVGY